MANRVSIFRVTTITILDDTIVNADISTTAAIARTKMNEDQDVRARAAASIFAYNSDNSKNISIKHYTTYGLIDNTFGSLVFQSYAGNYDFKKSGSNATISIFGSGGSNKITIGHDNTDGNIETNAGNINLNPTGVIRALKNIEARSGKKIIVYKSDNSVQGEIYYGDGNLFIDTSSGFIRMNIATGLLSLQKSGVDNTIRLYGNNAVKNTSLKHDDTNGIWATSAGDCKFDPAGDVDANNKTIKGINSLTYQAAKTLHKIIPACEFAKGGSEDEQYDVLTNGNLQNPNVAFPSNYFYRGLSDILPNGATITDVKMYYYQTDAAAAILCRLERGDFVGNVINVAEVADEDKTDGYNNKNVAVSSNNVLSTSHAFWLRVNINCNDDIGELRLCGIDVTYTVPNPD